MYYCAIEIGKDSMNKKIPCDFKTLSGDELNQHQFKVHDRPIPKKPSRWDKFTKNELRMIAYGLSQIHGDVDIDKMLKEINPLVFPSLTSERNVEQPKVSES